MNTPLAWCASVEAIEDALGGLYLMSSKGDETLYIDGPLGAAIKRAVATGGIRPDNVDAEHFEYMVSRLMKLGIILPQEEVSLAAVDPQFDRQARHFLQIGENPEAAMNALKHATVVVFGLGGVGGHTAELMARMGVGTIVGVDFDIVQLANLPRQSLFTARDTGLQKSQVATCRLREVASPQTTIEIIEQHITCAGDISALLRLYGAALFVLAADTPQIAIREWAYEASRATSTPYVCAGQSLPYVSAGPLVEPELVCANCATGVHPECDPNMIDAINNHEFSLPAMGHADALAASLIVNDVIMWISCQHAPALYATRLRIDLRDLSVVRTEVCGKSCMEIPVSDAA